MMRKFLVGSLAAFLLGMLFGFIGCDHAVHYGPWDLYAVQRADLECRIIDAPAGEWLQCVLPGQRRPAP